MGSSKPQQHKGNQRKARKWKITEKYTLSCDQHYELKQAWESHELEVEEENQTKDNSMEDCLWDTEANQFFLRSAAGRKSNVIVEQKGMNIGGTFPKMQGTTILLKLRWKNFEAKTLAYVSLPNNL